MMNKTWLNLKDKVEKIFDPKLDMRIHHSNFGSMRYWVTMSEDIIWNFPRDFCTTVNPHHPDAIDLGHWTWFAQGNYAFYQDVVIKQYVNLPRPQALDYALTNDRWGLGSVLRAADKRFGINTMTMWALMLDGPDSTAPRKVLGRRFLKK